MKTTRIENTVRNPKAAALTGLFLLLPGFGLTLCATVPFHDPSGFQEFWPVFALISLGCSWFFFIILSACSFCIKGKYIIEYDKDQLRVTAHSLLRKASSVFPWSDIQNVGFLASPRVISRGSLFIEMRRKVFRFGDELTYEEQIQLAKQLHETHEKMKSQPSLGGDTAPQG